MFGCLLGLFTDADELCNDADESVKSCLHQSWTFSQVQVCLQQKENLWCVLYPNILFRAASVQREIEKSFIPPNS